MGTFFVIRFNAFIRALFDALRSILAVLDSALCNINVLYVLKL